MIAQDRPSLTARTLEDVTASALVVGVGSGPDGPLLLTDAPVSYTHLTLPTTPYV